MKAELLVRARDVLSEDELVEMVVWRVPKPVPPGKHRFKYRLVYLVKGERVVGYDNERGKGDHCHLDGNESPYTFVNIDQLIQDFVREVECRR